MVGILLERPLLPNWFNEAMFGSRMESEAFACSPSYRLGDV